MSALDPVTVEVSVRCTLQRAWDVFTRPASITKWNFANVEWHCPRAENELTEGGSFSYRMEARDGSFGFDFAGTFIEVSAPTRLRYSLGADREVIVDFTQDGEQTRVRQTFTPEATHSLEQQQAGWQAILDNYRKHVEAKTGDD